MPTATTPEYPWYVVAAGDTLEQGDLILACPRLIVPAAAISEPTTAKIEVETVDSIVLTQSCDLALRGDGRCEAIDVMLCPVMQKRDLATHKLFQSNERWDEVRKGRQPYFHVLNACTIDGFNLDYLLVDFHQVYTLNFEVVRQIVSSRGPRARLAPPYREHLSQAFARLFMRVGLPTDVPPFVRRK